MLARLEECSSDYDNVLIINTDAQELSRAIAGLYGDSPVVMSLQNSLGTPYGNPLKIISEMVRVAEKGGEIIISLFTQESLEECGIPIYQSISGLVGEPDLEKTDFRKGDFVSKTGYRSHWWTPEERGEIADLVGGEIVSEVIGRCFYILHTKY